MSDPVHEVYVPCDCGDFENCHLERYVADIRSLLALYGDPLKMTEQLQPATGQRLVQNVAYA